MTRKLLNPGEDFQRMFDSVRRSAWRWERQGYYQVDDVALIRWRNGLPFLEDAEDRQWRGYIRELQQQGVPFQRVRMISDPPTEYERWSLDVTDWNLSLGEDIRWITRQAADELDLPEYDFYLIDNDRVAVLLFDEDKALTGLELIDDPTEIERHRQWRDLAWQHAIQHQDYRAATRGT